MKRNGSVRAGERCPGKRDPEVGLSEERRPEERNLEERRLEAGQLGEKYPEMGRPARRNCMRRIWKQKESAGFLSGIPGQITEGSWRWTGSRFGI